MKRWICILLVIVMAVTLCVSVFADESDSAYEKLVEPSPTTTVPGDNSTPQTPTSETPKENNNTGTTNKDDSNSGTSNGTDKDKTENKTEETDSTPVKTAPFKDVDYSAKNWYGQAVVYVYDKTYMTGKSKTEFDPQGKVTRAEAATILFAMAGRPVTVSNRFRDVNRGDWFFRPVNWAADMGIVTGYGNKTFGPKDEVTRQQLVTMMYRYAIYHGYIKDGPAVMGLAAYPDVESVAEWAYKPFAWAVANEVIAGNERGYLDPQGKATRAQMAVILKAFDANVAKIK